jgi:hypothetical protein
MNARFLAAVRAKRHQAANRIYGAAAKGDRAEVARLARLIAAADDRSGRPGPSAAEHEAAAWETAAVLRAA